MRFSGLRFEAQPASPKHVLAIPTIIPTHLEFGVASTENEMLKEKKLIKSAAFIRWSLFFTNAANI
jgi:hypothetical protein